MDPRSPHTATARGERGAIAAMQVMGS